MRRVIDTEVMPEVNAMRNFAALDSRNKARIALIMQYIKPDFANPPKSDLEILVADNTPLPSADAGWVEEALHLDSEIKHVGADMPLYTDYEVATLNTLQNDQAQAESFAGRRFLGKAALIALIKGQEYLEFNNHFGKLITMWENVKPWLDFYRKIVLDEGEESGEWGGLTPPERVLWEQYWMKPWETSPFSRQILQDLQLQQAEDDSYVLPLPPPITKQELMQKIAAGEDVTRVNTSHLTDLDNLFLNNATFNQDISGWDTSNVESMQQTFRGANSFNQPIGKWDVSKCKNFLGMFNFNTAFNQDLSAWDVTGATGWGFYAMFQGTTAFNQDISGWDTSNVVNMEKMFRNATAFAQDLSGWDVGNVTAHADFATGANPGLIPPNFQ